MVLDTCGRLWAMKDGKKSPRLIDPMKGGRQWLRSMQLTVFGCLTVLGYITFYDELFPPFKIPMKHHLTGPELVTLSAFLVAAFALLMIQAQGAIAIFAMEQQELIRTEAQSRDDRLTSAIESLAKELQRRPAPTPSVVTFSLFGDRHG